MLLAPRQMCLMLSEVFLIADEAFCVHARTPIVLREFVFLATHFKIGHLPNIKVEKHTFSADVLAFDACVCPKLSEFSRRQFCWLPPLKFDMETSRLKSSNKKREQTTDSYHYSISSSRLLWICRKFLVLQSCHANASYILISVCNNWQMNEKKKITRSNLSPSPEKRNVSKHNTTKKNTLIHISVLEDMVVYSASALQSKLLVSALILSLSLSLSSFF